MGDKKKRIVRFGGEHSYQDHEAIPIAPMPSSRVKASSPQRRREIRAIIQRPVNPFEHDIPEPRHNPNRTNSLPQTKWPSPIVMPRRGRSTLRAPKNAFVFESPEANIKVPAEFRVVIPPMTEPRTNSRYHGATNEGGCNTCGKGKKKLVKSRKTKRAA